VCEEERFVRSWRARRRGRRGLSRREPIAGADVVAVTAIESTEFHSVLSGAAASGTVIVTVAGVPDLVEAGYWRGSARRLLRVDLRFGDDSVVCVARGIGHRLPFARRLSLPVALGLGVLGTPMTVRGIAGEWPSALLVPRPRPHS